MPPTVDDDGVVYGGSSVERPKSKFGGRVAGIFLVVVRVMRSSGGTASPHRLHDRLHLTSISCGLVRPVFFYFN